MKQVGGIWFPDDDGHIAPSLARSPMYHGAGTYQLRKLFHAVAWCKNFRVAVDVGGHVGLWSRVLATMFEKVIAFEPVPDHCECFVRNAPNVELHRVALGERAGSVRLRAGGENTGNAAVDAAGTIEAVMERLDDFGLRGVDFLKIDCEGYELPVLRGATEMLGRDRPTIIVEQKPGHAQRFGVGDTEAINFLTKRGAICRWDSAGDYVMSWD